MKKKELLTPECGWSLHMSGGWETQLDRAKRWYSRATASEDVIERYDFLHSFFENAFHIKDWLINTGAVTEKAVNNFIAENEDMRLCRDLANSYKHYLLNSSSQDFPPAEAREYVPGSGNLNSDTSIMILSRGKKYDVFDLAQRILNMWENFIFSHITTRQKDHDTRVDIPKWAWYTGRFLINSQRLEEQNPETTKEIFDEFYKNHPEFLPYIFRPINPGTIMMLLYALLVVPKEIWEARNDFPFHSRKYFSFTIGESEMNSMEFIRLLRNAVAHAHFSVDYKTQEYSFWNCSRDGKRNFEVKISHEVISNFLTEIGKFYINYVNNIS